MVEADSLTRLFDLNKIRVTTTEDNVPVKLIEKDVSSEVCTATKLQQINAQLITASETSIPNTRRMVKINKDYIFIDFREVLYVEAYGDYVKMYRSGKFLLVQGALKYFETVMQDMNFIRVHRSTLVNKEYIEKLTPHFNGEFIVTLKNGTILKWTRSYRASALKFIGTNCL